MPELGLYFDLRNPKGWPQDPARLHAFTLEMCEEAERLGASSVWFTEHHLFDDGYLAQPLTFAAAVAARTSRVRIGTAIMIAPLHHPAELAEQAALVDILSDGRLDLGIGAGYRVPEYELYGASEKRRYAQTDERARQLRELWGPDGVTPRPIQDPMPLWMGYLGPQGARRAGLLGERLLTANKESWGPYREGLIEGGHDPDEVAVMAGGIQGWMSDDPDRDWPLVSKHAVYQLESYRRHLVQGTDYPEPKPIDPDRLRNARRDGPLGSFSYGTPEHIAQGIREEIGDAPVETVWMWASIGGMPEDVVAQNVQNLCTKLAPLIKDEPAVSDESA